MSRAGQRPSEPMPAAVSFDLPPEAGFDWHRHDRHQLARARRGVLTMSSGVTTWVLPPSRALWIPAGVVHSVAVAGATTMLSVYLDPADCAVAWSQPTVVDASGVVGALVTHLVDAELDEPRRRRVEAVLCDALEPLEVTNLPTPQPTDERARRVADALRADPTDGRPLAAWGNEVGASARTLARLFVSETGMGFERWRTNVRLAAALPRLACGDSVANVARAVGYTTPSAFVAAFRREIGSTPREYFGSSER